MYFHYIPLRITPDRGFCETVCDCKVTKKFDTFQEIAHYEANNFMIGVV